MKTYYILATVCTYILAFICPLSAQQQLTDDQLKAVLASLHWQTGPTPIPITDAHCTLTLTKNFKYLNAQDSHTVLEKIWGNPPDPDVLGMIFPINDSPENPTAWGVSISYLDNGHTDDSDAQTIDYDKLLEQMKQESTQESDDREKQGYGRLDLIGWAQPPRYDKESHKLFWARNYKTKNDIDLNYDFRILGRSGTLVLRAIASGDQLQEINDKSLEVISMAEFDSGNRYTDFNSWTDKVAEGGLAALVAGGAGYAVVKTGLLAGFLAFGAKILIAGWKFVAIGVVAVGAALKNVFSNMFGRKDVKLPNNNNNNQQ